MIEECVFLFIYSFLCLVLFFAVVVVVAVDTLACVLAVGVFHRLLKQMPTMNRVSPRYGWFDGDRLDGCCIKYDDFMAVGWLQLERLCASVEQKGAGLSKVGECGPE